MSGWFWKPEEVGALPTIQTKMWKNKEDKRAYDRNYYITKVDKKKKLAVEKKRKKSTQQYVIDYLKAHPCIDCGEGNPVVLEFDHRDDCIKVSEIAEMVRRGFSKERVQEEIDKCDVRCANCHRIKTASQLGWYKDIQF